MPTRRWRAARRTHPAGGRSRARSGWPCSTATAAAASSAGRASSSNTTTSSRSPSGEAARGQPPAALRRLQPPQGRGARVVAPEPGASAVGWSAMRIRAGRRPARVALAVALALLVALLAAGTSAARAPVCNGERSLCGRHFNQVVLPAAHNAMSAQSLGWSIPNQQVGIPDQLAQGIRGFLFDTYYAHREPTAPWSPTVTPTPQSSLYLCHVACQIGATPLIDVLRAMRSFLNKHPRNVLAIVNEDYVSPVDFNREFKRAGLRRHVWRGSTGPDWPTLRTMIRQRQSARRPGRARLRQRPVVPRGLRRHPPGDQLQLAHGVSRSPIPPTGPRAARRTGAAARGRCS